jgi:uncharacterized membrane protein YfcA
MGVLIYLILGVLTGILSGIFGIGGGVLLVPFLVLILRYSQAAANGTSLVALLLPVGLLGVIEYHKVGKLSFDNIKNGLIIAVGIFIGTYIGAKFAGNLPEFTLRRAFSVLLVTVAFKLWFFQG